MCANGKNHLKKICEYLIVFLTLALSILSSIEITQRLTAEKAFNLTVKVTYENNDQEKMWNLTENDKIIGLFMNNSWQTVYLEKSSQTIKRLNHDADGNIVAILDVNREFIVFGEKISYNVTYRLIYRERSLPPISEEKSGTLSDIPEHLVREYCKPTSLWQSNVSALNETARSIMGSETKVLVILKNFIKWIAKNVKYNTSEVPKYPNETFYTGLGDCDDQANLLITFCRAVGIPAYLQLGCIYIERYNFSKIYWSGRLSIRQIRVGWHGWAVVYIPPWGWLPVDLTYVEGDLKVNPLNAITSSAIIKHYTFQYINITKTDYIAEIISMKRFLEMHKFYIYEEDEMEEASAKFSPLVKTILVVKLCMFTQTAFIYHKLWVKRKYHKGRRLENLELDMGQRLK